MALDNIGTIVAEMNTVSTIQSPLAPLPLLREYIPMQWQAQAQSTQSGAFPYQSRYKSLTQDEFNHHTLRLYWMEFSVIVSADAGI